MADALRLSCNSVRCFSSLFTSFSSSFNNSVQLAVFPNENLPRGVSTSVSSAAGLGGGSSLAAFAPLSISPRKSSASLKVNAGVVETDQPKWWEKNAGPNMIDIHSTQDFLSALSQAGDKLVIVEFYGTWCASCRALFPKLCRTAQEHPEILFLKVNFDENKPMCKNLNVKVLPYFHFYRGADGRVDAFSCSLAKFQKIKDAIQLHNTGVHNIIGEDVNGMSKSIEDLRVQLIGQDQSTTDSSTT